MKTPLHVTLRQYRVASLVITIFFMYLTWDMWEWYKINHSTMKEWAAAGFVSIILFAAGTVKWSLESMAKRNEKDEQE